MAKTSDDREVALAVRVTELVAPLVHELGYDLVRAQLTGPGRGTLQVMVERQDRATMTVEHCAEVSRAVSDLLDVHDPFADAFTLEVSSPGLDRPLMTLDHFRRFKGFEARVELDEAHAGRRRFTGRIAAVEMAGDGAGDDGATIVLTLAEGPARLPFAAVRKAKLVLNDDLLDAARQWADAGRSP